MSARVRAFSILLAGLVGLSSMAWGAGAAFADNHDPKVFVCKYVGPAADQVLKSGTNPQSVNVNALGEDGDGDSFAGTFPFTFSDNQGGLEDHESKAIAYDNGQDPDADACAPMPGPKADEVAERSATGCDITHPLDATVHDGTITWDETTSFVVQRNETTLEWEQVPAGDPEISNVAVDDWDVQEQVTNGCVAKPVAPVYDPRFAPQTPASGCEVTHPATGVVLGAGVVTHDLRYDDTPLYDAVTNNWSRDADLTGEVANVEFVEWTAQERVDNGCDVKAPAPTLTPELVEQTPLSGCEVHDPATDEVLGAGVVTFDLRFLDTAVYDAATNTWSVENDTEGDVVNVDFVEWTLQQQVGNGCVAEAAEPTIDPELVEQAPVSGCEVVNPLTGDPLGAGVVTHDLRYQDTADYDAVTNTWSLVDDTSGEIANVAFIAWTAAQREANDCPGGDVIVENPVFEPPVVTPPVVTPPNGEEPDVEQPDSEVPSGGAVINPEVSAPGGQTPQSPVVPTSVDAGLGDLAATDQAGHAAYLLPAGLAAALLLLLAGLGLTRGGRHA